jgi:hypothetical protein
MMWAADFQDYGLTPTKALSWLVFAKEEPSRPTHYISTYLWVHTDRPLTMFLVGLLVYAAATGAFRLHALLDQRVPRTAVRTAAEPFRRLGAAFLADEDGGRTLGHTRLSNPYS